MFPLLLTTALLCAVAYLLYELYRRYVFEHGDESSVYTFIGFPYMRKGVAARLDQLFMLDQELMRATGFKNARAVNPTKPWQRFIVVADPGAIRAMFVGADWQVFQRPDTTMFGPGAPHGEYGSGLAFMPNGPEWRAARALFERAFSVPSVRGYAPVLNHYRDIFLDLLEKGARQAGDEGFDVQPALNRFAFDTIGRLSFGEDVGSQTTKEGEAFLNTWKDWVGAAAMLSLTNRVTFEGGWRLMGNRKLLDVWDAGKAALDGLLERNFELRRGDGPLERTSILDNALRSPVLPEFMKNDTEMKAQMATLLFAGYETTAGTTTVLMHFLATHPDWQQRIRKELDEAVGRDAEPTLEQLETMPALNAVIKETLRMYPAAPYCVSRKLLADFTLHYKSPDGTDRRICFKKGDVCFPFVYGAHRDQSLWKDDVDAWIPERWLADPNGGANHLFAYAPFGTGARRCVGERLALGEIRLLVSSICRKWKMEPGKYEFVPKQDGGVSTRHGVRVKLLPLM
ncbi:cytochrome P450 [Hyaloraphidium curvatum]|nr:cytochrome P450 [Hyaloraphidium curvatum]